MKTINASKIETPMGEMFACATDKGICLLEFYDGDEPMETRLKKAEKNHGAKVVFEGVNKYMDQLKDQLALYFKGALREFTVPLDIYGTDFQKKAWNLMRTIPYGKTISYKEEAIACGNVKASRAVAGANGRNDIVILIPCHRVIGSDGSLTGYSSGIHRKKWLLEFERGENPKPL